MRPTLFAGRIGSRVILAVLLAVSYGCSAEPEATFINFSQRMTVERPGDQSAQSSNFKVAVGSMISAQETAVYYHELLDYIAGKLGRNKDGIKTGVKSSFGFL
jgi:hypothetical protein